MLIHKGTISAQCAHLRTGIRMLSRQRSELGKMTKLAGQEIRFVSAPTLETVRLRLRSHLLSDFQHCAALWADPLVTRYIGGAPQSREDSWSRLLRYVGHWHLLGFGYWVAEERVSGTFVGELGFADYRRDLDPTLDGIPEAGWVFAPSVQGKGYATEAVQAILSWGEMYLSSSQTACLIHPDNAPSLRVAQKCGYIEKGRTSYKNRATIVLFRNHQRGAIA